MLFLPRKGFLPYKRIVRPFTLECGLISTPVPEFTLKECKLMCQTIPGEAD